jgi:hypothetical protein
MKNIIKYNINNKCIIFCCAKLNNHLSFAHVCLGGGQLRGGHNHPIYRLKGNGKLVLMVSVHLMTDSKDSKANA